jgi:uncharacterized protein (DUF2147 family)
MSFLQKFSLYALPILSIAMCSSNLVFAQEATGVWLRDTGTSKIRVAPCGDALCGTVIWESEPKKDENNPDESKRSRPINGTRIFFNMKPNGENKWSGSAYNPEDGKTYSGNMIVNGSTLVTKGCVLGGFICKSVSWSKP